MTVRRKETWHNTSAGHSKQYILTLEEIGGRFSLTAEWGRIGATNLQSKVYVDKGSLSAADSMWDRLAQEKLGKGYYGVGSSRDSMPEDVERTGWPSPPVRPQPARAAVPTPQPAPKKKDHAGDDARKLWL